MRPTDTMACPVCGVGLVEDTSVPCESCGFVYPSARFFASPAAYSAWRDLATDYERESLGRVRARLSSAFALQGGGRSSYSTRRQASCLHAMVVGVRLS